MNILMYTLLHSYFFWADCRTMITTQKKMHTFKALDTYFDVVIYKG